MKIIYSKSPTYEQVPFQECIFKSNKDFLAVLCLYCCTWLSVVAANGGCSLVAQGSHAGGFPCCRAHKGIQASVVSAHRLTTVVHRLSCSVTCGFFLEQGLNPCSLHWQADC